MKICYQAKTFRDESLARIKQANDIIDEYAGQGFDLTLRQLYYQFVARDLAPNTQAEYKRLVGLVSDGRLAGLLDWSAIQDRTRNVRANSHWESPQEIVETCAGQYAIDRWAKQACRCEVWIEKDALLGVIEGVCEEFDVPFFSCRGFTSQSEMWRAAVRMCKWERGEQKTVIIHLGDHDPSGIDMTRDIQDRLELFGAKTKVERIALNMDQVEEYEPPPNPAKTTDSRFAGYSVLHGDDSWELDALDPPVLVNLIRRAIKKFRDPDVEAEAVEEEKDGRRALRGVSDNWEEVCEFVENET